MTTNKALNNLPDCPELHVSYDHETGELIQVACVLNGYSSPCIPIYCPRKDKGEVADDNK